MEYAGGKIASVRSLRRTTKRIVQIGEEKPARTVARILGGILTTDSSWNPPLGDAFRKTIIGMKETDRLDIGIAMLNGSFLVDYEEASPKITIHEEEHRLLYFLFSLMAELQKLGTVAAIDFDEYRTSIERLEEK